MLNDGWTQCVYFSIALSFSWTRVRGNNFFGYRNNPCLCINCIRLILCSTRWAQRGRFPSKLFQEYLIEWKHQSFEFFSTSFNDVSHIHTGGSNLQIKLPADVWNIEWPNTFSHLISNGVDPCYSAVQYTIHRNVLIKNVGYRSYLYMTDGIQVLSIL